MDFREDLESGIYPLSIEILAAERAAIVPDNDAIWIQHRDYLEDELVSQKTRSFRHGDYIVNGAFHHKAR